MITRIKWKNHNVLGNLELDFAKEDGLPYNTILIAGENGVGKTTILDTLAMFLGGNGAITPFEYIEYMANNKKVLIYYDASINMHDVGFHKRKVQGTSQETIINQCKNVNGEQMMNDQLDIRSYGVAYSRARSGFKTDQVKTTTTMQLDDDKSNIDNDEDFTKIKQLIIDISSQDNSEYFSLAKKKKGKNEEDYDTFIKNSRIYRFENAFNKFFDNIKFDAVDEQNSEEKKIIFKKYNKEISIDSLSTGEKQIVFRGAYLLKNQRMLNGGIVLIDEPELSMHPLWQEKILEYYRSIFTTPKNLICKKEQKAQMIIATHSEYVIKSALEDRENVLVIALKNVNSKIEGHRIDAPMVLPTITLAETNYNTFNIVSNDYHIQLYGYLQTLIGNDRISDCDKYINNYINSHSNIDKNMYLKQSSYTDRRGNTINYYTLSTYIRNAIDHPDNGNKFTDKQLSASIELLIEIINAEKVKTSDEN
ncbi:MAG: AAA family ATPase [Lachnospiraceae bacterium]|nr:AAA family ATPase [Lachnospiraceae bacterium]